MDIKAKILTCLGPGLLVEPRATILSKVITPDYVLETILLELNEIETVPAYFAYPPTAQVQSCPLVLFNHSHGGDFTKGKEELIQSSDYLQPTSFLQTLTKEGYAVGVIDMWGFGERNKQKESELFKEFLLKGHTLWGMRIYDNQQFLTYLLDRPEVNPEKVATMGMSMGGMMSWWLAALDERIHVVVDIAAQVEYEALIKEKRLDRHGFYYYVPGILKQLTTNDIQQLIVPRARLCLIGRADPLCPIVGVTDLDKRLHKSYLDQQASNQWACEILDGGHQETREMRERWIQFLRQYL